jgi:hypothetical protein
MSFFSKKCFPVSFVFMSALMVSTMKYVTFHKNPCNWDGIFPCRLAEKQTDTARIAVTFRKFFCKRASELFRMSQSLLISNLVLQRCIKTRQNFRYSLSIPTLSFVDI